MDNEKNLNFGQKAAERDNTPAAEGEGGSSPRARNRTVMLTPEITGQVRARLAQEVGAQVTTGERAAPVDTGFVSALTRKGAPEVPEAAPRHAGAAPQPAPHRDGAVWSKLSPIVGFMVSFDSDENGEVCILRKGRLIVTSEAPSGGNFMLIRDETVSPMHAIVRVGDEGDIRVLDQLSEYGTTIKRRDSSEEIQLSGDKCDLHHGDLIRFGQRSFKVCLLDVEQKES